MTTTAISAPPPSRKPPPKPDPPPAGASSTLSLRRKSSQRMTTSACTATFYRSFNRVPLLQPSSSIERGQLDFNSRDSARSARIVPPVWQRAQ